jgi:hypothetical protein
MARHRCRRPGLTALRVALAVVAVAAGTFAFVVPWGPAADARSASPAPEARVPGVVLQVGDAHAVPPPVAVRIPAIGLQGPVDPVGLDASGSLVPPEDTARAGWFADGPAPGAIGPAVLAGHIDSWRGPGVFFRLDRVVPGQEVLIERADGSTLRFTVTRVAHYPKQAFPTADVYGPTADPELRLITCGGAFDRAARSYVDNVVVYARAS